MAIRNVGNNNDLQTICDFQNDIKGAQDQAKVEPQPAAPSPAVPAPAAPSTGLDRSLRARTTLSSRSVKAALDARLGETSTPTRTNIPREFQTAFNNMLTSSKKLGESSSKFTSTVENQLSRTKTLANQFLGHAQDVFKTLSENRNGLSSKDLSAKVESLVKNLENVINIVRGETGDLMFNANAGLKDLGTDVKNFQSTANLISKGQLMALPKAMDLNTSIAAIPGSINGLTQKYATSMTNTVKPLADEAKSLATAVDNDVDSFSLGGAIKSIGSSIKDAAIKLADKGYNFTYGIRETIGNAIDEYMGPLTKALGNGLKNLFNKVFNPDKNPNGKSIDLNKLVSQTQDLRNQINAAKSGNTAAANKLKSDYGYTTETAPKPGQMWVAANFTAGDLENGKVTANNFPGGGANKNTVAGIAARDSKPPSPKDILFGDWKTGTARASKEVRLMDINGKQTNVKSMEEYKAVVAANRQKLGMPLQGGEPIPIHLSLEGGGGAGKRYAPAFEEMYNLGVVPASVSGTSAGAIAAALVAGGLDPRDTDDIAKDPALKKFFDATIEGPGVLEGRELYRFMDQKLRELTGITDRPVTFADLPMPLNLIATKLADSQATNDMTKLEDRLFVFSRENTPDTPVAMAVVASTAIPGAFDPIEYVDVATGRTIRLCDGGVLDNLPIGYQKNDLPEVAIQLNEPNNNNRDPKSLGSPKPFPPGNLISGNPVGNAKIGLDLLDKAATGQRDYQDRINPKPGTFVLNVPTWNLNDFSKQNSTFNFEYDNNIDPGLDVQTAQVTQNFFRTFLGKLQDPNASGTNLKPAPANNSFNRTIVVDGKTWNISHNAGSDEITLRNQGNGRVHNLKIGNDRLSNWVVDDVSFGDLNSRLRDVVVDHEKFLGKIGLAS